MNEKNIRSALIALGLFLIWCYRKTIGDQLLIILGERVIISGLVKNIITISTNNEENYFIKVFDDWEEENIRVKISKEDFEKISPRFQKEKLYVVVFCGREKEELTALDFKTIEKYIEIK